MEKTYAQRLSEKKIQFEKALEIEMDLLEVTKKNIKNMAEEDEDPKLITEVFVKDKEHRELVVEALQDSIDGIDGELRKETVAFEPMSPKDLGDSILNEFAN